MQIRYVLKMKKTFRVILKIFDGIGYFLDTLNFLGLLFVIFIALIATPVYLLTNYTEVEQPVFMSIVIVLTAIFAIILGVIKRRRKKNTDNQI